MIDPKKAIKFEALIDIESGEQVVALSGLKVSETGEVELENAAHLDSLAELVSNISAYALYRFEVCVRS